MGVWFSVDVELIGGPEPAAVSDDLASAVDYGVVARRIVGDRNPGPRQSHRAAGRDDRAGAAARVPHSRRSACACASSRRPCRGWSAHPPSSWCGSADAARLPLAGLEPRRPARTAARGGPAAAGAGARAGGCLAALRVGGVGGRAGPDGRRAALVSELRRRGGHIAGAAGAPRSSAGDRGRAGPHPNEGTHAGGAALRRRAPWTSTSSSTATRSSASPTTCTCRTCWPPSARFVLRPLADIAPELTHPTLYRPVRELLAELADDHEVRPGAYPTRWLEESA